MIKKSILSSLSGSRSKNKKVRVRLTQTKLLVKKTGVKKKLSGLHAVSTDGVETEQRILIAARNEFISKGLEGARMQAIAKEAKVNQALLHYYFRSKDQLYQRALKDIFQSVWIQLREEFKKAQRSDHLETLISIFVSTYLRALANNPHFPLFIFREVSSGGKFFQPIIQEIFKEFNEVPASLIRALKNASKSGKIRPIEPLHFFLNLGGMCIFTFLAMPMLQKLMPEGEWNVEMDETFIQSRIDAITSMIFYGLKNTKKI